MFILLFLFQVALTGFGQILTNGSLEGQPGTRTPDNWSSCLASSSVDIQPGTWGVIKAPQDGNTYINMVCRGSNYIANEETCEELAQVLNNPLIAGRCYRVEMYLSLDPTFGTGVGITEFTGPINLRVSGGTSLCRRDEIIVEYETVEHEDWRRYVSYFTPDQDLNAIWFEGTFDGPDPHFGHILVDNVAIEEVSSPETQEITVCENESTNLSAFLAADAQGFNWSTGAATPTIEVSESGTYTVDITLGECVVRETFEVTVLETPAPRQATLCENESTSLSAFLAADAQLFSWSTGARTSEIEVTEVGVYTVDITLGTCVIRETFEVILQEAPVIELTTDLVICPGEEIILDAFTPYATFLWQDGSTDSELTITDTGTYSVTLTIDQCITSHTITILLDNCEAILEMPNAFTPNNDTKNDLFTPIRVYGITSMQTVIYNRWGENIYTTNNLNIEWNGHLPSDEPAPASTYYWRISYTDLFGEQYTRKGTVSLIR
ncbi:MAG: hypothetical protein Roseis2KO_55510 [Roseivirga sp.]